MKILLVILGLCVALAAAEPASAIDGQRRIIDLAGTWQASSTTVDLAWPADGTWMPRAVPAQDHASLIADGGIWASCAPADLIATDGRLPREAQRQAAWFRRNVDLPVGVPAGMRALLRCEQVAWRSVVRVNGADVGCSVLGAVPNVYDITAALRPGSNELAIGATGKAGLWDAVHRTYVAPFAPINPGITGAVRLELVPEMRIEDVWVRTAVAQPRLTVCVELVNAGAAPHTVRLRGLVRGDDGVALRALAGPELTVAPGATAAVEMVDAWRPATLWSPASPALLRCEVAVDEAGAETDRQEASFGFREFSIRGRDFLLNGNRQVLLRNSWLYPDLMDRGSIDAVVRAELSQSNCVRLHLGFLNQAVFGQADRAGLMVIPEPAWFEHGAHGEVFSIDRAGVWLPAVEEMWRRLVRRHRNHPSIVLWSLANEWAWDTHGEKRKALMGIAERLAAAVRVADPDRPLQADGETSWNGTLETINIHYPEGDAGVVNRRFGNAGWVMPNDLGWLRPQRDVDEIRSWRGIFRWDRPLMIGEYYALDGWEPEEGAAYMGDEAYDARKWERQPLIGRGAPGTDASNGYLAMMRMSSDRYRAAGVACLNPWAGRNADIVPPLLARPLDFHPNVFAGDESLRQFLVANDGPQAYPDMNLCAQLTIAGSVVWEQRLAAAVRPGMRQEPMLTIRAPRLVHAAQARLIVQLRTGERELSRYEEDMWVLPKPDLSDVDAGSLALIDSADGPTTRALAGLRLALHPGAFDDQALTGRRVLIVGEGAVAQVDLAAAARFAAAGGRVVVLHQESCPPFLPGQPAIDPRHAASMSWRAQDHSLLDGLADGQLRWWRGDHLVASHTMVRPAVGGLAVCGGRYGLSWSPLVEVPYGRGMVVFCQYLLVGRAMVEPVAAELLARLVRGALTAAPNSVAQPLHVAGDLDPVQRALFAANGVALSDKGDGPVLVDARRAPPVAELERLRQQVEAGGHVWLRGLDAVSLPAVATLLPWQPGFAPLPIGTIGLSRRSTHSFGRGLMNADLWWARGPARARKATAPLGGPVLVPPIADAGVALTEPALLTAVPCGRGWILVDNLAWEGAAAVEGERVNRIISTLARNLGAAVAPPQSRRWHYTTLDLAGKANRGYLDRVAGDGVGGWTDQGDNDMRYFLINHSGIGDGGMAVPVPAFPVETIFNDVPFRLADPAANGGRAVVTLRGGNHDPVAPSVVRGIPAGGITAERLWFLHAATWCPVEGEIARYEIVYADGSRAAASVRAGRGIADWWSPRLLPEAAIAWSGRNPRSGTIAVYSMAWDNPFPDRPIQAIDVVGDLAGAQLVLLGITLGSEERAAGRPVAAWDCARFVDGAVFATTGGLTLRGKGSVEEVDGRLALRLSGGQSLAAHLSAGPLADGRPVAIEVVLTPLGLPGGYYGGVVHAGDYLTGGVRMLLRRDMRVVVEHFSGSGETNAVRLVSRTPLVASRTATLRYEHDGARARLLIDGVEHDLKSCPPAAPWRGDLRIGTTSGTGYSLDAAVSSVRILALSAP